MSVPQNRMQGPAVLRTAAMLLLSSISLPAISTAAPQCTDWDLVPTPNVGNSVTRLTSVTALSPDDAWAVGLWRNVPVGFGPLALRWDGTGWSEMSLPGTAHLGSSPQTEGVESSGGDVWVFGNVTTTYPTYNMPLVLRWRGGSWDFVDTVTLRPQTVYPFAARGGMLHQASALTPDDIWAVGLAVGFGDGGATSVPLAVHWDGSSWTDVDVPRVANRHHDLTAVVAISADDVWAVGEYRNIAGAFRGVTYHWDGTAWSHVHSPIEDVPGSGLFDVVATGPDDVWAIGSASGGPLLMHWDGGQWSSVQPPPDSGGSLAAVGTDDLWASGWDGYWHWDGSAWTSFPAQVPGASYVIRNGGMEIVGDCDIWNVGFWTLADGITSYTLAERLQGAGSVGTGYCISTPNSTGASAGISASGSAAWTLGSLVLAAQSVPNQLGVFFHGRSQSQVPFANGFLCTTGGIARGAVIQASANLASYTYDNSDAQHSLSAFTGTVRNFQYWFRDPAGGGLFSNSSDAVAIAILP